MLNAAVRDVSRKNEGVSGKMAISQI